MLRCEDVRSALILSPHADDEVLGCGALMARLHAAGTEVHVLYGAVDGFHHYGYDGETTYAQRVEEIDAVAGLLGHSYEVLYGDKQLIERLDTLPARDLVDAFERALNERRPDLLLVPSSVDYDQDHLAFAGAALAAARPIPTRFGKWMVPHVLSFEMAKIGWADGPLHHSTGYVDATDWIDVKCAAVAAYATQLRPSPHIRSLSGVRALATLRGAEIGVEAAEAFGVLRTVL